MRKDKRYVLTFERSIRADPDNKFNYQPLKLELHSFGRDFSTGWVLSRPYRTEKHADASGLRLRNGRLHGRLAADVNYKVYDFEADATLRDGVIEGLYQHVYGKPDPTRAVAGNISGTGLPGEQDISCRVDCEDLFGPGKYLSILLTRHGTQFLAPMFRCMNYNKSDPIWEGGARETARRGIALALAALWTGGLSPGWSRVRGSVCRHRRSC